MTDTASTVPSPCRRICEIHPVEGVCMGCFRTIDEIAAWSELDDPAKQRVLDALPARRLRWASAGTAPA